MNNNEKLQQEINEIRRRIAKLDEQIHRIELDEAVAFFDDFAKDCPKSDAGCSDTQTSFSRFTWR